MDIASLVLGILSMIFSLFCGGCISVITAPIGLVLGIVDLVNKNKGVEPKGIAIAGIVLNGLAIFIAIIALLGLIALSTY